MGQARTSRESCAHVGVPRSVAMRANSAKSSAMSSGELLRATARAAYSLALVAVDTHASMGIHANWVAIFVGRPSSTCRPSVVGADEHRHSRGPRSTGVLVKQQEVPVFG